MAPRPCIVPCTPAISGPNKVIWRTWTTKFLRQLANDVVVHAATTRCMQQCSIARETGQEDMETAPSKRQLYPKKKGVVRTVGWALVGPRTGKNELGPSVSVLQCNQTEVLSLFSGPNHCCFPFIVSPFLCFIFIR